MLKNAYLYGDNGVPEIPQEIIEERLKLLDLMLSELLEIHYLKRDSKRINDILSALKFWNGINKQ